MIAAEGAIRTPNYEGKTSALPTSTSAGEESQDSRRLCCRRRRRRRRLRTAKRRRYNLSARRLRPSFDRGRLRSAMTVPALVGSRGGRGVFSSQRRRCVPRAHRPAVIGDSLQNVQIFQWDLGGGYKYDLTLIRLRFDRRSTPIRLQFGRRATTIRRHTS